MSVVDWTKSICLMDGTEMEISKDKAIEGITATKVCGKFKESMGNYACFYVDNNGCIGGVQVIKNKE